MHGLGELARWLCSSVTPMEGDSIIAVHMDAELRKTRSGTQPLGEVTLTFGRREENDDGKG